MRAVRTLTVALLVLCVAEVCHAGIFARLILGRRGNRAVAAPRVVQTRGRYLTTHAGSRFGDHPLVKLIRETQLDHVGVSGGPQAHECFTWEELRHFQAVDVPARVTSALRTDPEFLAIVDQIRKMSANDRSQLLYEASTTYKPTWAQIGRISPEGQTDAGQQAEWLLARAIANLVQELLSSP